MDKATVIGGSGFLGSHIADELSERGYAVTIFDHSPSPWICDNQTMVVGDMLDRELLQKPVRGRATSTILEESPILAKRKRNLLKPLRPM